MAKKAKIQFNKNLEQQLRDLPEVVDDIARPVAEEMVNRGIPYQGLLYGGAAWGPEGPAVVEFNARFGDPETQAVLSLLETPLAGVLLAAVEKLGA